MSEKNFVLKKIVVVKEILGPKKMLDPKNVGSKSKIKSRQIERSVFFSSGPQWTNSNLQTGLRLTGSLVLEKSKFSDKRVNYG